MPAVNMTSSDSHVTTPTYQRLYAWAAKCSCSGPDDVPPHVLQVVVHVEVAKVVAPAPPPLALMLVIDRSASMTSWTSCGGSRLQNSLNVSKAIVESLPPGSCCGIVEFSGKVRMWGA